MMRSMPVIPILALVVALGCERRRQAVDPVSDLHGDLLAALATRHWSKGGFGGEGVETCVLDPETTIYGSEMREPDRWETFQEWLPGLRRDTYDNLWAENVRPRPVAPTSKGPPKLHVLSKAEDAELTEMGRDGNLQDAWETFHERYPRALRVGLSAPGFSKDGKQAVIYYAGSGDSLAGAGYYCLLTRKAEGWTIDVVSCVWQS